MNIRMVALFAAVVMCSQCLAAQIDTTRREFFPMHLGDLWQYRNQDFQLVTQKVISDTLIGGRRYFGLIHSLRTSGGGIQRVDSQMRVQIYGGAGGGGDTCGGEAPREWSVYRLAQADSSVWRLCENFWGYLSPIALARFNRISSMFVFGQLRQVMTFDFGGVNLSTGDTLFGPGAILAKGIGIIREEYYERDYFLLSGAIIDSVQYGTIVGVDDEGSSLPDAVKLDQNFPNPFNPSTRIGYSVPHRSFVSIGVYNVLGQEVATLVDGEMDAGRHFATWNAAGMPSGVYFCRLKTADRILSIRLLLLR